MNQQTESEELNGGVSRRDLIGALAAGAAVSTAVGSSAMAQAAKSITRRAGVAGGVDGQLTLGLVGSDVASAVRTIFRIGPGKAALVAPRAIGIPVRNGVDSRAVRLKRDGLCRAAVTREPARAEQRIDVISYGPTIGAGAGAQFAAGVAGDIVAAIGKRRPRAVRAGAVGENGIGQSQLVGVGYG